MMNKFREFDFQTMLEMMSINEAFKFIRFGDGEMRCILKPNSGSNCDNHTYFVNLSEQLIKVLDEQNKKQTCFIGIQNFGLKQYPNFKDRWPNIEWCNADILHHASIQDKLLPIWDVLKDQDCFFVGPGHFKKMGLRKPIVSIPPTNCWLFYERIRNESRQQLKKHNVGYFSCSMMAEVLIHELSKEFPNSTLIDAGSLWEPYCGVRNRSYHSRILDRLQNA